MNIECNQRGRTWRDRGSRREIVMGPPVHEIGDRLEFVSDSEVKPVDLDVAVARFLLSLIRDDSGYEDDNSVSISEAD